MFLRTIPPPTQGNGRITPRDKTSHPLCVVEVIPRVLVSEVHLTDIHRLWIIYTHGAVHGGRHQPYVAA